MTAGLTLDRNKTIWQRIQERLEPSIGRADADRLATTLLPLVVAERREAASTVLHHASERARALVPLLVLGEVSVVRGEDRRRADVASSNQREVAVGVHDLQSPIGHVHAAHSAASGALAEGGGSA